MKTKIAKAFYNNDNVVHVARELIGKILVTNINSQTTMGIIVETEAYQGLADRASHAYNGKRTARNEHMYAEAGTAYVYICYGMHQMMNIVTNKKEVPDAILIRAVEPLQGLEIMQQRTGKLPGDYTITRGPGNVAKAFGIAKIHSGISLTGNEVYLLHNDGYDSAGKIIGVSARIGIHYAGLDAALPYRFFVKGNKFVSGGRKFNGTR